MKTNSKRWLVYEDEFLRKSTLSYEQSLKLLDGMWEMGIALGVLPPEDPLEGIEVDIKVARVVNCLKKK